MLASIVMPVGEGFGWRGLAAWIAPSQGETHEEQQPDERSERQKAIESIPSHLFMTSSGDIREHWPRRG